MVRQRVAVLTDSAASLPPEVAADRGIAVVPLHVVLDGEDLLDSAEVRVRLAARMREGAAVGTSQPSVPELAAAMRAALDDGAEEVVCLHLAAELSGTVQAARHAAAEVEPERIHVVDTRTVAGGVGLAALAAADAAASGGGGRAVAAVAREVAAKSLLLFAVPDLQYLQRGGRLGTAPHHVGTALGIRPILGVQDGRITLVELSRGLARTRRRMVGRAVRWAGGPKARVPHPPAERVRLAVHSFDAGPEALALEDALAEEVAATGAVVGEVVRSEVTAVIGAHVGPGVLGVVVAPAARWDGPGAERLAAGSRAS